MTRAILHVDMDAFYASVEERDNPQLHGQPLIVGGLGGRGVVAAANYAVRRFGVHSAMPVREALRRCPAAICVPPRMAHYQAVSQRIFALFAEFTPLVEGLSLDEAFLDVTHSQTIFGPAERIAADIKRRIRAELQLTASVGVAPNKLVAKIASDLRKPDGLMVVATNQVQDTLAPLSIRKLFGIGPKTAPQLEALGLHTLGDLRQAPDALLRPIFGAYVGRIKERAAGKDERPVIADADEKRISAEQTFATDIGDPLRLGRELTALADRTAVRLRERSLLAGCVVVKIREQNFTTHTRQQRIHPPSQQTGIVAEVARKLLDSWLQEQPRAPVRLLGVGAGDLTEMPQLSLFDAPESRKNQALDSTVDSIRARYGRQALVRGETLRRH